MFMQCSYVKDVLKIYDLSFIRNVETNTGRPTLIKLLSKYQIHIMWFVCLVRSSLQCIRSFNSGYTTSSAFVYGDKNVIVGTRVSWVFSCLLFCWFLMNKLQLLQSETFCIISNIHNSVDSVPVVIALWNIDCSIDFDIEFMFKSFTL